MSFLDIRDLSVSIHGDPILTHVSLSVAPGQITGIIGESGSGKSMTALAIMRLLPRGAEISGGIHFGDRDLAFATEAEMCDLRGDQIGMVFQEPMTALNPLQTIGTQVAETVRMHSGASAREAARIARQTLDRVELPEPRFPLSLYPHELSGGQRQRVVIAMAIARRPKLLIADEPTTALDVTTQAQILTLIRRLVGEDGMGAIFITHDLAVVSDLADQIVIMRKGAVVEAGPTDRVFAEMTHPYTRALFEASSHQPPRIKSQGADPILSLRDVRRVYPGRRTGWVGRSDPVVAVDGVSFDLRRGENLGLVGESGCGKSTLTRAILGLDAIQGGEIRLDGDVIDARHPMTRAERAKMQVVFQDPYGSFNPRHKVGRLVAEPLHLLEAPPLGAARTTLIAEALQAVGLRADDAQKYIHEFSGGQRQRIAIARALLIRPELIILDEAVSALDVQVRAQILDLLADLSTRFGLSYLFISHDLHVVRNVTDRVLIMKAGRIVEGGATEQVFTSPRDPYTKELIAATPVLAQAG